MRYLALLLITLSGCASVKPKVLPERPREVVTTVDPNISHEIPIHYVKSIDEKNLKACFSYTYGCRDLKCEKLELTELVLTTCKPSKLERKAALNQSQGRLKKYEPMQWRK